jgi:methyl-accepting chemotaxis protein
MNTISLSVQERKELFSDIYAKANRIVERLLFLMFLFGVFVAFFYDTWLVAFGVGSLCLLHY